MSSIQKSYIYKVYSNGVYLGNLPNVISDFTYTWDINTAGSQLQIVCAISADISNQAPPYLTAEDGTILTAEDGTYLTADGVAEIVVLGETTGNYLFRNGNKVKVYEISNNNINGKIVFQGTIERIEADFGGNSDQVNTDDQIQLLVYSDGQDLNNSVVPGDGVLLVDAEQLSNTTSVFIGSDDTLAFGQTVVAATNNIAAIEVSLHNQHSAFPQVVTLNLSTSVDPSPAHIIGSTSQLVTASSATDYLFTFPVPVTTIPGATYFFWFTTADPAHDVLLGEDGGSGGNAYPPGTIYLLVGSLSSGHFATNYPSSLYFITYYSTYSVSKTFSSEDPSNILKSIIDTYVSAGGLINYAAGTIDLSGVSATYVFNLSTVLAAIQVCAALAPFGFYWYVDVGSDTLYFKNSTDGADIVLTKGNHINAFALILTTENISNLEYFSGGLVASNNLFSQYSDQTSIQAFGPRLSLQGDNRVTLQQTADILGAAFIAENKDEQYQTQVTVLDSRMDTTIFKPGLNVGFNGFGTLVDDLVLQIVEIVYKPEQVTLMLGRIPPRTNSTIQEAANALSALQTVDNPDIPTT